MSGVTLILPYWDRQKAADKALAMLDKCYRGRIDLEVLVMDDGNPQPFVAPDMDLELRVVRRPIKAGPSSCISAWNHGVREAKHDRIALSCVEILHYDPVLPQMDEELDALGPDGYVLAACWCPELREWHCHSLTASRGGTPIPIGTGRSFLGLMNKELFWRAGGFDEDYAAGAGYEDVDFIYRMLRAGARFVVRDDLVVIHPKTDARIHWPAHLFERNKELLERKWKHLISA